jgi:DNA-binding response OmpR family regulator
MTQKIKVLMVDDETRFRESTSKLLIRRGFETTMAGSGEEALSILKKDIYDVVILDVKMPGMDGHEALAEIKKINPETQVIMLTGHGTLDSAQDALTSDAFDYLNKPCDIAVLSSRISDAYLEKHHKGEREEKSVKDIMIPIESFSAVTIDNTVKDAIMTLMQSFKSLVSTSRVMETGHRSLLVFDKKKLVGILSIMDLMKAVRPSYLSAPKPSMADSMEYSPIFWKGLFMSQTNRLADINIMEVMSEAPTAVNENANLMEVADLMYTNRIRRLIVSGKGKVVGVVREQEIFFEIANIILNKK